MSQKATQNSFTKSLLISVGFFIVLSILLVLITTAIAYSNNDPDSLIAPLATTALYITCFLTGVFSSAMHKSFPISAAMGGIILLIILCASAFSTPESTTNGVLWTTVYYCLVPVASAIGGLICCLFLSKARAKPKRRRRK